MLASLVERGAAVYVPLTFGALIVAGVLEMLVPQRAPGAEPTRRWLTNIALWVINRGLLSVVAPAALAAWLAALIGPGHRPLARLHAAGGDWVVLAAGLLLIDLSAYLLHRLSHRVGLLWRFHAVHHADHDVDASTALRHHPGQFLINATVTLVVFTVLGMPPGVFAVYLALSTLTDMAQHANLRIAPGWERAVSLVLVSPAQHRTHHSSDPAHHGRNFGAVLSVWDRLFGTLHRGEAGPPLVFGLAGQRGAAETPIRALAMPWRRAGAS